MTVCEPKGVFVFNEVKDLDFRTRAAGRFNNWQVWEYLKNAVWTKAARGEFPSKTNNVFISHATVLKYREKCKDFNINTSTTFDGEGHELLVNGKIRKYTGTAPGSDDPAGGSLGFMGVNSTFIFTGSADLTIAIAAEFGLSPNNGGFKTVIDFGKFKASTTGSNTFGEDLEIKTGTFEVLDVGNMGLQLLPVIGVADATKTSLLINAAARFDFNGKPGQSATVGFGSYVLELSAFLGVQGAASLIKAQNTLSLLGTVELLSTSAQDFPTREIGTELAVDTFSTLKLGTSVKTLKRNIAITTLLSMLSDATVIGAFSISYVNGDLKYTLGVGRDTSNIEFPVPNPPNDLIIEEDVRININKDLLGDIIINSNELDLSIADIINYTAVTAFTFGFSSGFN